MTLRKRALQVATFSALALALAVPARGAVPDTPNVTAEQLADQAYQQHAKGQDADAIATYLRAYELSHAAAILFNVATIYERRLNERGLAEDFYRRYLAAHDAEPDLVKKATERLTALKKADEDETTKRAALAIAPVPAPPPPQAAPLASPPPAPPASVKPTDTPGGASNGHGMRNAGIVVGVVGVVGVGAGLVLGALAKGKNDDANAVCSGATCSSESGVTSANQAGTFATASTISFISGLALAAGGVTLILLAPKDHAASPAARITVTPQVGFSRLGLGVGGTF